MCLIKSFKRIVIVSEKAVKHYYALSESSERTSRDFNENQPKEGRKIFYFFNFVRLYQNHQQIVVYIPKLIIFIKLKIISA